MDADGRRSTLSLEVCPDRAYGQDTVQTTHKIPGDSATRYAHYLTSTASRGDYYIAEGEADEPVPSTWHGSPELLGALGLDPSSPVSRSDLREVMHGRSPASGRPLRPVGADGTRVAAVELMMAPPKSVSALWATADPYRRAQIEAAHRKAVASALERTEREVPLVRRKTAGVVRFEKVRSLLGAEFVHTSSRLAMDADAGGIPDPQLHSHLLLFAAERKDGKLAAIESRRLYRSARESGAWYRSELAAALKELGLRVEHRTGRDRRYFELRGVPEGLASRWSSRAEDVDRAARLFRRRYGREPRAEELGSLTTSTRGSKSAADRIDVDAAWRAVGEEHGLGSDRVKELFSDRPVERSPHADLRAELLEEVTRERSTIEERELRAKAYELSAGVCRPEEADKLAADLERSGELVRLEGGHWTTRRLRAMEQAILGLADRSVGRELSPVSEESLRQARREAMKELHGALTAEQREALRTITGSGGISVLVGRAGAGKGVVLSAAARAWQLEGREVHGTAIAGVTAQRLKEDAHLDASHTADGLIRGVEEERIHLGERSVVIMDEAGMADTDRLSRLVKITSESRSKLVLAGDAARLGPIGAGGLFPELQKRVPTAELTEVHRANHDWERRAWEQVREGESGPALAAYHAHDRLQVHDTRAEAAEAMVDGWEEARRKDPSSRVVMITDASNSERDQINALAQECRARAGDLGSERVELPGRPYSLVAGDEVIFSAPFQIQGDRRVENGTRGTVVAVDRDRGKVTIGTEERESRQVEVDTRRFTDLNLGYAVHVYKAQGLTTKRAEVLIGGWQTDREGAYVALSRAREETRIHVSREDLGEAGLDVGAVERLGERMRESRAQEASVGRETEREREDGLERIRPKTEQERDLDRGFGIE
jgi:conjugative relaxase-like TrwC/TraI family protein